MNAIDVVALIKLALSLLSMCGLVALNVFLWRWRAELRREAAEKKEVRP